MWDKFKLEKIHVPRGQISDTCICDICTSRKRLCIGHEGTSKMALKQKKILPRGEEMDNKIGEPVLKLRCSDCLQLVGRGISHPCTVVSKKKTLLNW